MFLGKHVEEFGSRERFLFLKKREAGCHFSEDPIHVNRLCDQPIEPHHGSDVVHLEMELRGNFPCLW